MIPGTTSEELQAVTNLTLRSIRSVGRAKLDCKKKKEMFDDGLKANEEYRQLCEDIKDLQKARKALKAKLLKEPAHAEAYARMKEAKAIVKAEQLTLGEYLQEFEKLSGQYSLEDPDTGDFFHITKKLTISGKKL